MWLVKSRLRVVPSNRDAASLGAILMYNESHRELIQEGAITWITEFTKDCLLIRT